jgi:hypothetical protein
MGLPLITRTEYKTYAEIKSDNSNAAIDLLIPKVSELVKNYCRRTFVDYVNDNKVETTSAGYGTKIFLKEFPILAVSSVDYSEDYGQTYTSLVEFTDYVVDAEDGTILSLWTDGWTKAINGYQITYSAGYETLPEDLKLAVMDLVTYYLKNDMSVHSPKAPGTNSVQVEYITTSALPAHIRRVLDLYKGSWD